MKLLKGRKERQGKEREKEVDVTSENRADMIEKKRKEYEKEWNM